MTSFPIKPDYIIDLNIKEQLHMDYAKKRRIGRKRKRASEIKGRKGNNQTMETDQM